MIFDYEYKPVIEDFSKDGTLTLSAMIKILENAGNAHSDLAGDSVFNIKDISRAWILTDWQIEISEYASYGDKILAQTWSEGFTSPLTANRNFLLYKNGQCFAKGTTRWVLMDFAAKRPCKIESSYLEKYSTEDKVVFEEKKLWKIPAPESWTTETKITVRRSDIDFNEHVHNLTYIDYARELLPSEVSQMTAFKKLRITYKTALREGGTAVVRYAYIEDSHVIYIFDAEDHLCCQLQFT